MDYFDKEAKIAHEKELLNRWDWLTEGLDYNEKLDTSIVLENSYGEMISQGQLPRGWLEQNILNEGEEMLRHQPLLALLDLMYFPRSCSQLFVVYSPS